MTPRLPHSIFILSLVIGLIFWAPASRSPQAYQGASLKLTGLRTEYKENPFGIDARKPRLSWQLQSSGRGVMQAAYQIRAAKTPADLQVGKNLLWDSGKVSSDESLHREYAGAALQSGQRYYWQARVWDAGGKDSGWSETAHFEMGLLDAADWKASWIEPDLPEDMKKSNPAPMLRREFKLNGAIDRARAYITSHGVYEAHLNGQRVGDQVFTPGWTSYNKQLQYQTYDVTSLLSRGDNAVGVMLGDGWYRGNLAWGGKRNIYGDKLGLLLQIEVTYKDGRKELVNSDQTWKASTGPILMSEIYHGETYDARLEKAGWTNPGFSDAEWAGVKVANHSKTILTAPAGPPIRRIEELKPVKILKTPAGETVVDFGQNLVGWVRLKVQGAAGKTVTIRHAEVLDKAGNFYIENMRAAKTTLQYTLKGGGVEIYEPHFTFFGYRYVAVEGWPGELTNDSLTSVVVHSDMARTGELETNNALTIIPWTLYQSYGDKQFLANQYPSMVKWVEYQKKRAGDDYIWDGDFHFGDWLAFATTQSDYPGATTSKELIATAMFAHSTDLLGRTAQVLGKQDDAAKYADQLAKIKAAFRREFVTETARVGEDTQTAYSLALQFDLLPEAMRPMAAQRLAKEIRNRKHLTTGFVGTPYLCHVLSRYGYLDEAYLLLNRDQYPSWLYPVKQGATTIWERWDGQKPDGTFQDKGMNSFNHYAYGAIGEWMYRVMAGIEIDPAAPGYKHILIQPQPGGGFTSVKASHQTMYGKVSSAWTLKDGQFELVVEIPANTHATIRLPKAQLANVTESGAALASGNGVKNVKQDGGAVVVDAGSGQYRFVYALAK